ncbi:FKBP-type peptidyl-prolyl cis-trans isomerase [Formosa sp. S-31]|uniref:FKBP-type peptidyl-prolyl cis-trans isomerase n=1 Tax=Formosa sp. S-31 TaxID=2790949 RepID=UPI003EC0B276
MKLRTVTLTILLLGAVLSCKKDDDKDVVEVEVRDRAEVYEENIAELEAYLDTHFYNYEEFDFENPYSEANDNFQIVIDTIAGENSDKIPLIDRSELKLKLVNSDSDTDEIEYKLYYLELRKGLGDSIHPTDRAHIQYKGMLIDNTVFDSAITPVGLSMSTIGSDYGVVKGFKEGTIEFRTSVGNSENGDGTVTYHNHGIGALFIPSGLGYFSTTQTKIPAYSNLIFLIHTPGVTFLDHDGDLVPSYMEDLNGNGDIYDDDTDGDEIPDALDIDDDGDGVLTPYEDIDGDGDPTNDIGKNGIPKYLDAEETESNE